MAHNDYTSITELPAGLLSPHQIHRFAHRYGYAHRLARGQRVLEVGCGAGSALNFLAQDAAWVVGLDYTGSVLAYARKDTYVPLVQGDAQQLPFASAQFDLILCFEAIYYLAEYRDFLAECHRLLAPAGKLLICQSNPDWPNFVPGALTTRYPSLPELAEALTQVGLHEVHCFGTLPITTTSARQRAALTVRQWVARAGIMSLLGPLKRVLQTLSYGQMHPLPATIDAQWIAMWQSTGQSDLELTPHALTSLSSTQPDRVHRVVYVEGSKSALSRCFTAHCAHARIMARAI